MRKVLFELGGRKFLAFAGAFITTLIMWQYGKIEAYEALIALVTNTMAYLTSNVVDGAIDANKAQKAGTE